MMFLKAAVVCALLLSVSTQTRAAEELEITLGEGLMIVTLEIALNQSRPIELVTGNSYIVSCTSRSGGFQESQVWFRDDAPVAENRSAEVYAILDGNTWRLELNMFNPSATGTYSCRRGANQVSLVIGTGNPVAIASSPFRSLNFGPQGSNIPALFTFASGNPLPELNAITWTLNGNPLAATGGTYLLAPVIGRQHAGNYVCNVTTSAGTALAHFTVMVNEISNVMIFPNEAQTTTAGLTLTLVCNDSVGMPPPTFQWRKARQPITGDGSRVVISSSNQGNRSTLTISPVQPDDAGVYDCTGTNMAGTSTSVSVNVEVMFPPVLSSPSTRPAQAVEATLILEATITANPSTLTGVMWSKGGLTARGVSADNETSASLTITGLAREDEGVYLLTVTNEIGSGTLMFYVTVNFPPTLRPAANPVYARTGSPNVTLSFMITEVQPAVEASQISWARTRGGETEAIDLGLPRYSSVLTEGPGLSLILLEPVFSDSGVYTVRVEHVAGNVSFDVELTVLDPPAPPTNINATLVGSSPCIARIQWTTPPPFNTSIAMTDYTVIEARARGESEWVELVREVTGVTEAEAMVSFFGLNTLYQLRGRGGSNSVGEGSNEVELEEFTAYLSGLLPTVVNVTASPATPTSIRFSWDIPQQNCYSFLSHTPSCEREGQTTSGVVSLTGSDSAIVEGLAIDTLYNCSVSSVLTDSVRGLNTITVSSRPVKAFTYPDYPPTPDPPRVNQSTIGTITVNFNLPSNSQDISHYQVIVLRLTPPGATPTESPDELYGPNYVFADHASVHSEEKNDYEPYIAAELAAELFSPVFVLGNRLRTNSSTATYINGRLAPGTPYTCFLRAFPKTFYDRPFKRRRRDAPAAARRQYDIFSSSDFLAPQQTEDLPAESQLGLVIGVCVAVLVVLGIFILVVGVAICCIRTRKQGRVKLHHKATVDHSNSTTPDGTPPPYDHISDLGRRTNGIELKQINMINPMPNGVMFEPSGPIKMEDFSAHVERFDANRQLLFQEEFEWIQTNSPWHPSDASNHPLNDEKNRYHNITAFDHTRVKLSPEIGIECSDYINANYILGYSGRNEYIATQGPLEQTVVEFWKMVWEQNTHTIVMLTDLVELGKVKCTQYWPINGTVIYGGVKVTLERVVELPHYTIRNLLVSPLISNESESRVVMQFQFTRWPDYGVPKLAAPLINFLRAVNMSNPAEAGPIVVHCSAGVGRSGTVITIDYCLKQLKGDRFLDPCGFVQQMRNQRNYMVQTDQQYTFLHFALLEAITYGDTSFELADFSASYKSLKELNPSTGDMFLEEEFGRIGKVKTMTKRSSFQQKIKHKGAPQRHFNSSFMGSVSSNTAALDPYSAHFIDTYSEPRRLIVVDGPTDESIARWWQMVWDEDVAYVVNLTPQDEESFQYWPDKGCVQYGGIVVEVESETAEHLYTRRRIKLTNAKVEGISHSVEQFHFIGWTTQFLPRVPDFVGCVCEVIKGVDSLRKNQRILLHDIDSLGPCGVMCSLYCCIERLRMERIVDVFQAVQMMKLQRPGSVKTVQEYAFIYDCVFEFIRIHFDSESAS